MPLQSQEKNHRVFGCDIFETNGGIIANGGDRRTLTESNIVLSNCNIRHFIGIAIILDGVGITVMHNEIHNANAGAINFSGNIP